MPLEVSHTLPNPLLSTTLLSWGFFFFFFYRKYFFILYRVRHIQNKTTPKLLLLFFIKARTLFSLCCGFRQCPTEHERARLEAVHKLWKIKAWGLLDQQQLSKYTLLVFLKWRLGFVCSLTHPKVSFISKPIHTHA